MGCLEQDAEGDVRSEFRPDPRHDPRGDQGVAAEGEEVVVEPDPVGAEQFGVDRGDGLLDRVYRCAECSRLESRDRQCFPVEFAVRGDRQCVEHEDLRGHHVGRQFVGDPIPEQVRVGGIALGGDDVADEPVAGAGVAVHQHDSLRDLVGAGEDGFDFTEFDAEATHLHLGVAAADEVELTTGRAPHQVSGAVHEPTGVGVGDEAGRRQLGPAVVAAGQSGTGQVQLADDTVGHGVQAVVEDDGPRPADRRADGDGVARAQRRGLRDDDGGFGGAVAVDEPAHGAELGNQFRRAHVAADHDRFEIGQVVGCDGAERGGRGEDVRNPFSPQQIGQFGATDDLRCRDDHRGTDGERGDLLEHRGVEARRREPEHPRLGAQTEFGAVFGGEGRQTAVGDDDTLRGAGRSGGVDHVGGGPGRGHPPDRRVGISGGVVDAEPRDVGRRCVTVCKSEKRTGIRQQVRDARGGQRGVDRYERRTGLGHRPQCDDRVDRARERQCHERFRRCTVLGEHAGETVGRTIQLGVRQVPGPVGGRDAVRVRGDTAREDVRQHAYRHVRGHGVPERTGGVDLLHERHLADRHGGVLGHRVQQPQPAPRQGFRGTGIEQVRRVGQRPGEATVVVAEGEFEVHLRDIDTRFDGFDFEAG